MLKLIRHSVPYKRTLMLLSSYVLIGLAVVSSSALAGSARIAPVLAQSPRVMTELEERARIRIGNEFEKIDQEAAAVHARQARSTGTILVAVITLGLAVVGGFLVVKQRSKR